MKKRVTASWLLISALTLVVAPLWSENLSYSYPDVNQSVALVEIEALSVDDENLQAFLEQWGANLDVEVLTVDPPWVSDSSTVAQLESVYRIQNAQLEQLRREARPVFSIMTDPSNPLYGFSRMKTETGGPTVSTVSHKFGIGAGISQQLNTAGSIDLSLKQSISYSSIDGKAYSWKQAPSVGISFQQPLGIGDRVIDGSYGRKVEEKQLLQQTGALEAVQRTSGELAVQTMQLYHTRQALLESRWLLVQQSLLSKEALERAQIDYDAGLVSRNQVIRQELTLRELLNQVSQFEQEIAGLEESILTISGIDELDELVNLTQIPSTSLQRLLSYRGGNLPQDEKALEVALRNDNDYVTADRELQMALLDKSLGNPGDAPRLSISMQLSPFYTVSPGNTIWDSVDRLFTTGSPNISVSVSFMATDLSRSLSKTTGKLVEEQIIQANISKKSARRTVMDRFSHFQREIDRGIATLTALMDTYSLAETDVEVEQIRAEAGASTRSMVKRAELGMYEAAFAVLQQLRSLRLLEAQLSLFVNPNDL